MNAFESLTQPLYDTVRVHHWRSDAFTVPVGRGESCFGSGPKGFADTNMFLSGALPIGMQFWIRSLYVEPIQPVTPGYVDALVHPESLAGAHLNLVIGSKVFLTIPVSRARASLRLSPHTVDGAVKIIEAINGVCAAAVPMLLGMMPGMSFAFDLEDRQLSIADDNSFRVEITGAPEDVALRVYLNGTMLREIV